MRQQLSRTTASKQIASIKSIHYYT